MDFFLIVIAAMVACNNIVDGRVVNFAKLEDTKQNDDAVEDEKRVDLNESLEQITLPPLKDCIIPLSGFTRKFPTTTKGKQFMKNYFNAFNECMLKNSVARTCSFECNVYVTCHGEMKTYFQDKSGSRLGALMPLLRDYHNCLFEDCEGIDGDRSGPCTDSDIDSLDVKSLQA
mmetsp:Transcript_2123/g.3693  ORF Transcript_2123/g.3693 Transcript_2123/m.3693 type:complete len:173 (-) Transcript_2123:172-690(-)|eukprot:CAMPEP_0201604628 /NCGR_PEP_ID=MMETSP0492-20130828/4709_1 /ASSEMBLY_ACC=CAM_ASM_000837 /TAXON_ID=420259 /ORGANISM="Thalassiosira gravida, Strain GMp14c1" /LENGTH=172 /DNA_ID=CAMNT_0048068701 /DNA_START=250 /DNA_END=768 /DNA_ORIENTATION=+